MSILLLLLAAIGHAAPAPAAPSAPSEQPDAATSIVTFQVFERGRPVPGLAVVVDGQHVATTDALGNAEVEVPAGRRHLMLFRRDDDLLDLDFLTDEGEIVQLIVTVGDDGKARLDVETSAGTSPFAEQRLAGTGDEAGAGPQETPTAVAVGALVGRILSEEDGRPIVGARVFFTGTTAEATTDRSGEYAVELPEGLYALSVIHPDYATQTLENIRVIGAREVSADIDLTPAGIELQEYVVTAPYVEGSVADTIGTVRDTASVVEAIGAEQMQAAGDSDAGQALQRVSGLTVEQGRFVLVRGQPFRYTYTQWNGLPLPSPEPLVRVVPLDLFPTGVLSAVEVQKSYSADVPADFGAGLIDLQTRGVPEEAFFSAGLSTGANTASLMPARLRDGDPLKRKYGIENDPRLGPVGYDGGRFDYLGYDDGGRAIPAEVRAVNEELGDLRELPREERDGMAGLWSNNYDLEARKLPPDFGFSLSGGGSVDLPGNGKLGVVSAARFSNNSRYQLRSQRSFSLRDQETVVTRNDYREFRTDMNADLGGLVTLQAIWDDHDISASTFYAHQTQRRSEFAIGEENRSDDGIVQSSTLSWLERQLVANQLVGSSRFGRFTLDYRGLLARADRDSPDRRTYAYIDREPLEGIFAIFGDSGVLREYNEVSDNVRSYAADLSMLVSDPEDRWLGLTAKVGVAGTRQDRSSVNRAYNWSAEEDNGADVLETRPEVLYDPANAGPDGTLEFDDKSRATRDDYIGTMSVIGGYGLLDARFGDLMRLVGGLRYERAQVSVVTYSVTPDEDSAVKASFDHKRPCLSGPECALYPSLSSTFFLTDEIQLRAAYGRSTSRPNLNELSDARFIDPDSGEQFVGDPDLQPTMIDGLDARIEWYPSSNQVFSIGVFRKDYTNPIERADIQVGGSDVAPTFQNATSARVLGFEAGGRVSFGSVFAVANLALLNSVVNLENQGVSTSEDRPVDGQAAYTLNVQTGYSDDRMDLTVSLNVVGRRFWRSGVQGLPDVYLGAVPGLDAAWSVDVTERFSFRLGAENLLNSRWQWTQGAQTDGPAVWRDFVRGTTFSASIGVKI